MGLQLIVLMIPVVISHRLDIWWPWIPALVVSGLFHWFAYDPFADRERKARARLRRAECLWCGKPSVSAGMECSSCHHFAPPIIEVDHAGAG